MANRRQVYDILARYPLRQQILAGFAAVAFLALATATIAAMQLSHLERHISKSVVSAKRLSALANAIAVDTLQCRRYEKDMFLNLADAVVAEKYEKKWVVACRSLTERVRQLGAAAKPVLANGFRIDIPSWKTSLAHYRAAVLDVRARIKSGQITNPSDANQAITPYKDYIRSLTIKSVAAELAINEYAQDVEQGVLAAINSYRVELGLLTAVLLVLGTWFAKSFSLTITHRADKLCRGVKQLAGGQYHVRTALDGRDEFATLGRAIDHMAERIEERTEQAEAASRAKSDFLANMSHEIRTPMTAILGFTDQLLESGNIEKAPPQRIEAINTIRRNGDSLLCIINDILDLSKIEAGKMTIERESCQPCRIIADVASLMQVRADAKGLRLRVEFMGPIPETVQSDPTRLRQILINLVGNAIKFTETGAVRLVTSFVNTSDLPLLQFDIIDTGLGMTSEQVGKLFQPFTQADASTTRRFGGTGLGLTISKHFAGLLGGDITVAETTLGVGSTFRVTVATGPTDSVRMLDDPASTMVVGDRVTPMTHTAHAGLEGLRVLLAEDGPDNQRLISFVLKKAGAEVTIAENGKIALDAALAARDKTRPFDCILMDMQMPVMGGYEATTQLRKASYTGVIIALTAHAMASDRAKCIEAGCDDYSTKPIDRIALIDLILKRVHGASTTPETHQTAVPAQPLS